MGDKSTFLSFFFRNILCAGLISFFLNFLLNDFQSVTLKKIFSFNIFLIDKQYSANIVFIHCVFENIVHIIIVSFQYWPC